MRAPLRILGATATLVAAAVTVPLLATSDAQAAGFTGGDLVVYRVGTGSAPLTNAATAVFLDEFSPSGTKVQSIALPTVAADGNRPLTAAGQSRSEGLISRSPDGRYVALTGYAATPGATGPGGTSLTATDPASTPRVVGLVDRNGVVDTSSALTGASVPQVVRSATTVNGDEVLAAGGNGGLLTTSLGSTTTSVVAGDDTSNLSSVTVQGGSVFTSGILADRLARVGSSVTDVPGLPDNLLTYGYALLDLTGAGWGGTTLDTLYVANASERAGTVDKYRYDGSTWTRVGAPVDVPGVTGLVADSSGGNVSLALTTPTQLLTLTDVGAATAAFAPAAPVVLATAAPQTEFRGVALAPTGTPGPSLYLRTPVRGSTTDIGAGGLSVSALADSTAGAVSGVSVTVGSTTVAATKGAGRVWTATVPGSALSAGNATVSVAATDALGTTTVTRPVVLSGSSVPAGALTAGTYAPSTTKITRTGTWKAYAAAASPTGKGLVSSTKNAALAATAYGRGLVLTLTTGPKAGKVKVTVDGHAVTLDLYAKRAGTLTKTWTFAGSVTTHPVKVTALGAKSARSAGKAVGVAAVKVKP